MRARAIHHLAAWGVFIATTTVALAAAAPMDAAAPTGPARLELRLETGRAYRFQIDQESVSRAALPGGASRRNATRAGGAFDLTVERANTDGSYTVRVHPVSQTISINDRSVPVSDKDKGDVTANLSRRGLLSGLPERAEKKGEAEAITAADFLNTLFDEEAGHPASAVSVGESWKDVVKSPLDEKAGRLTVHSTLVALERLDGRGIARVLNVVSDPVKAPEDENGVTMEGTLEGGGLANVDIATGLPVEGRDVVRLKLNVSAPAPDGSRIAFETETNISVHVREVVAGE